MSEQIQVKRSLLRLRQATVAELADHSGVKLATVKSFLHDHPAFVEAATGSGSELLGRGRGRPATVWRLKPAGEAALIEEMRHVTGGSDALADERARSDVAVRRAVTALFTALEDLRHRGHALGIEELDAERARLRRRAATTRVALLDLIAAGHELEIEKFTLEQVTSDLGALGAYRVRPKPARQAGSMVDPFGTAQEAVGRYVSDWFSSLRREIEDLVTPESLVLPDQPVAAPMLLLDGIPEVDAFSQSVIDRYRMLGAPVLHLPVGRLESEMRGRLLELIGHRLALAAGAAAQVVLTIDGSRPGARELAREFADLERMRTTPKSSGSWEAEGSYARALMSVAAPLISGAGLAIAGFRREEGPNLAAAALLIAGRLIGNVSRGHRLAESAAMPETGDLHVPPLCLDVSVGKHLASLFESTGVGYVVGQAGAGELPNPLSLTSDAGAALEDEAQVQGSAGWALAGSVAYAIAA